MNPEHNNLNVVEFKIQSLELKITNFFDVASKSH